MLYRRFLDTSPRQWAAYLARRKRPVAASAHRAINPAVFVLSTGRVGTKTLAQLGSLGSNLISHHEPEPILYGLSKAAYQDASGTCLNILSEAFLASREHLFAVSSLRRCGYLETSPQLTFLAPAILNAVPHAKFVHLVRHPMAVVRSGMRRRWYGGHKADATRITPRPDSDAAGRWAGYDAFHKNLWLWKETNGWVSEFLTSVPEHQQLVICSEQLFSGDTEALKTLYDFLEAENPPHTATARILNRKSNAQEKGEFPLPALWTPEMLQQTKDICGDTARQFGYEIKATHA